MILNKNDNSRNIQSLRDECERLSNYHVLMNMADGSTLDGIIERVEGDNIIVLIGEDVMEKEHENQCDDQRQYGRPRRRFRRFRRRRFPLGALLGLSLLSYPPYPYYYPYPYY